MFVRKLFCIGGFIDGSLQKGIHWIYGWLSGSQIWRFCYKERKKNDGDRVVIIEDVTTAGTSIEETLPIIKAQGDVNPIGLVVSVDRMERGKGTKSALSEIEEKYGLKTTAIVTMAEVVEHLYNKEYKGKVIIDDKLKAAIDAYYEQYGVKE